MIVQHLYNNKQVSLQGIGTFKLDNFIPVQTDPDKEPVIPAGAILFEYNPRATEDAALIDSIVLLTKKIKPLATADLDSYLMLGRQFLNIGKPFIIEGLGTLDRTREGQLEFIPGIFTNLKVEAPKALKENEGEVISGLFNDYGTKPQSNSKRNIAIVITIIVLGVLGWAVYHYLFNNKVTESNETPVTALTDTTEVKKDSIIVPPVQDSSSQKLLPDSDGYTFRVVFKVTNSQAAAKVSMNKLNSWGHKVIMYTEDSVHYKLAELFKLPLSDTARIRDSLYRFYDAKNVIVEVR